MTNYRVNALMARLPYGQQGKSRGTWGPGVGSPRPGRHEPGRSRPEILPALALGGLLLLGVLIGLFDWMQRAGEGSADPVLSLIHDVQCGDPELRRTALKRLAALGPAAAEAVPALTEALDDPQVCYGALQALRRILGHEPEWRPRSR